MQSRLKARANPSAPRWEYNCIEADRTESFDLPVDALNKNGAQGWSSCRCCRQGRTWASTRSSSTASSAPHP